ncbi:MAG TPA: leucyl aminopeptidase [Pyrinomonadaceae bacterium]|nr:leucyl aminopeptidase [Pyrinomonadaceae bacterium]
MKSQAITDNFQDAAVDALAVTVFKDEKANNGILKDLDKLVGGNISSVLKSEEFKGETGETAYFLFEPKRKNTANRLLLVGAGDKTDYKASDVYVVSGAATRFLRKRNVKSFALMPRSDGDASDVAMGAAQGVVSSQFELDKYKTQDKNGKSIDNFVLFVEGAKEKDLKDGLRRGEIIGDSMNFTRDLANEPPNILHPTEMADRAQKMAKEVGLKCDILDEKQMEKLGMGSLMSVSHGSSQPAKMIVLKYEPKKSTGKKGELLALVGKGITFDTGGISIKPSEGMEAMKYDMSGGATVIGTMRAIGLLQPTIPVLGVVAAVENMPDGKATRPSDVVTAMNGKTVEILNTDAEGRLVLADAVAYAEKQGATRIVDMATLTGAVIIALGDLNTAVLGNDQDLVDEIIACGKEAGENFWQLPIGAEYSKAIKSDIADIKNIGGGRKAGTIIGAVFIQEFVKDAKWAHLDIAGTAWADNEKPHHAKGPTAVAVRTLLKLVEKSQ